MLVYLIKSALVLSVLYTLYRFTLRRETFHRLSRVMLIAILLTSVLLPAIPLTHNDSATLRQPFEELERWNGTDHGATAPHQMVTARRVPDVAATPQDKPVAWSTWANRTYAATTAALLLWYALSLLLFVRTLRSSVRILHVGRIDIRATADLRTPVSWMQWILVPAADLGMQPADTMPGRNGNVALGARSKCLPRALLYHELAHVRGGHSWDRLLCDLLTRLMWFCPFAWMLRGDLISVHEFMADRSAVQDGMDTDAYSRLLIDKAAAPARTPLRGLPLAPVQQLSDGGLKRRLRMLYAAASHPAVAYRAWLLLPLAAFMWLLVGRPSSLAGAVEARSLEELGQTLAGSSRRTTDTRTADTVAPAPDMAQAVPQAVVETDTAEAANSETAEPQAKAPGVTAAPAESASQLARRFGLPHAEKYRVAVGITTTDRQPDIIYMVDGRRVTRETFERHATLHDDPAAGQTWALAGGEVAELSALTRDAAVENMGIDAPVMHVRTRPVKEDPNDMVLYDIRRDIVPNEDQFYLVTRRGENIIFYNMSLTQE